MVPASSLVGREGQGVEIAHRSITEAGKPNLTAVALGIHQAVLETVVDYANTRRMYDRPLASVESVRTQIADIYSTLQTSRMMAYQSADLLDNGFPADEWLLTAKLTATENAVAAAQHGVGILGARTWGRLGDRYGWMRQMRWFGFGGMAIATLAFAYVPVWFGASFPLMVVAAVLFALAAAGMAFGRVNLVAAGLLALTLTRLF